MADQKTIEELMARIEALESKVSESAPSKEAEDLVGGKTDTEKELAELQFRFAELQSKVIADQYNIQQAMEAKMGEYYDKSRFEMLETEMRLAAEQNENASSSPRWYRYDGPFWCEPVIGKTTGKMDRFRVHSGIVKAGRSVWEWDGSESYDGTQSAPAETGSYSGPYQHYTNVTLGPSSSTGAKYVIMQQEVWPSAPVRVTDVSGTVSGDLVWSPPGCDHDDGNESLFGGSEIVGGYEYGYKYRPYVLLIDEPPDGFAYQVNGDGWLKQNTVPPYVIQVPLAVAYYQNGEIVQWRQLFQGQEILIPVHRFYYWGGAYSTSPLGDVTLPGCIWAAALASPVCVTPMCITWTHWHNVEGETTSEKDPIEFTVPSRTTSIAGDPPHQHSVPSVDITLDPHVHEVEGVTPLENGMPSSNTTEKIIVHPQENYMRFADQDQFEDNDSISSNGRISICDNRDEGSKV